ncbi:hypothetical protein ACDY94_21740 [Escherichia coli]|uniref:hypothetical protein n=1 Tax=Atlantibacter hermannii TaxID=565 RepID=UPI0030766E54
MNKILVALGFFVFVATCAFALREPETLFFIIPTFIFIGWLFTKIAEKAKYNTRLSKAEQNGTLRFCAIAFLTVTLISNGGYLYWINSFTPIFGDEYTNRLQREENKKKAEQYEQSLRMEEFRKTSSAKESVKKSLKDSSSAKFSGEKSGRDGAVCGYVNAKNSFGAYAGDSRYISISGRSLIDDGSIEFKENWERLCI